jgi:hypothetical protein
MNIPKHVAGIALFILIVAVSVFIASIVAAPLQMIPPVQIKATRLPPVNASTPVNYKVQLVSLDFINRKSYTTLTLKRDAGSPAPDVLWVETSLFIPEHPYQSWWGQPIEIRQPFANGDQVSLTVTADCEWCADASAPRAGYYARVGVSTTSAEDATCRAAQVKADIKTALPVLVQVERKPRR